MMLATEEEFWAHVRVIPRVGSAVRSVACCMRDNDPFASFVLWHFVQVLTHLSQKRTGTIEPYNSRKYSGGYMCVCCCNIGFCDGDKCAITCKVTNEFALFAYFSAFAYPKNAFSQRCNGL